MSSPSCGNANVSPGDDLQPSLPHPTATTPCDALFVVNRDLLRSRLRLRELRQNYSEQTLFEGGRDLVLIHVFNWDPSLKAAVITLAKPLVLVFALSLLLTADGENAVRKLDIDILLVKPWQLGSDLDLPVRFTQFDIRPMPVTTDTIEPAIGTER